MAYFIDLYGQSTRRGALKSSRNVTRRILLIRIHKMEFLWGKILIFFASNLLAEILKDKKRVGW
jgi:hypothetical protein